MYRMTRRNIAVAIILSIVTCGIYMYYWIYKMAEDINYVKNDPNATSPGLVVVFSLLTCGIYFLFWIYKAGEVVDAVRIQQGMQPGSKAILYLILSIFGFSIVSMGLLQNDLNEMADGMGGYGNGSDTRYGDPYAGGYAYSDPNPYGGQNMNQGGYGQSGYNQNPYGQSGYDQNGYAGNPNAGGSYGYGQYGYDQTAAAPQQPAQPPFGAYEQPAQGTADDGQKTDYGTANPFENPQNGDQ